MKKLSQSKLIQMDESKLKLKLENLDKKRIKAHDENDFLLANNYKVEINKIKKALETVLKKDLNNQKLTDEDKINQDFNQEWEDFELKWDTKLTKCKEEFETQENNLIERHEAELNEYFEQLNEQITEDFKESNKMLELKDSIDKLKKAQNYIDAHHIQQNYEKLKLQQVQKSKLEKETKINKLISYKQLQQEKELSALRDRLLSKFNELELEKATNEDKLKNKFNNIKNSFEKDYKKSKYQLNKSMKNFGINGSVSYLNSIREK